MSFTKDGQRIAEDGIIDKSPLIRQSNSAFKILNERNPSKILTLGGECSESVPSFTYLTKIYQDDVALLWIDAHPDIGLPNDSFYQGYHAMTPSAILGKGGLKETFALPSSLDSNQVLLWGFIQKKRRLWLRNKRNLG